MKKNEDKKKVLIIGAGPAGLAAAYRLVQKGHFVHVIESAHEVGGLARSFDLWGQIVDLGPHRFFSSDPRVNQLWEEVIRYDYTWVDRLTRIYYRNRFFLYPLDFMNVLRNLSLVDIFSCAMSYLFSFFKSRKTKTFEDWVVSRFGLKLFNIFFKTYTEKVWGIPCNQIDADWAAQRIKKLSLFEAVKAAFFRRNRKKHKTLVDRFAYPKKGCGSLYLKMAHRIRELGGVIELNSLVARVLTSETNGERKVIGIETQAEKIVTADVVISTMPLTLMVKALENTSLEVTNACHSLKFRNTILVYVEVDSSSVFLDNWLYIHSPEVLHGRVTNFRNWCPSLNQGQKTTILCMEYWCFDHDLIWTQSDDAITQLAESELNKVQILPSGVKCLRFHIVKLKRSYPVYEIGYMEHLSKVKTYLNEIKNLFAIGRYGSFKYNNQDHSILMGLLAAIEIDTNESQNLWELNSDSEYQESTKLSDLSLTKSAD